MTFPTTAPMEAEIWVAAFPSSDATLVERAGGLAQALGLPLRTAQEVRNAEFNQRSRRSRLGSEQATAPADQSRFSDVTWILGVTGHGLDLRRLDDVRHPMRIDLLRLDAESPAGRRLAQPLSRAIGLTRYRDLQPLHVCDATAGLGEDAWLLATWGCRVQAIERHPVIAALLRDAVERAGVSRPDVAARVDVITGDAHALLAALPAASERRASVRPHVVYLDPMFPGERKAAPRKAMAYLRALVGDDQDAAQLLSVALAAATHRVTVKRAPKAPALAGAPPTIAHEARGARYDVYAVQAGARA